MSKRQQTRRMRPDAIDPIEHNRTVRFRKDLRSLARASCAAVLGLRRMSRAFARFSEDLARAVR